MRLKVSLCLNLTVFSPPYPPAVQYECACETGRLYYISGPRYIKKFIIQSDKYTCGGRFDNSGIRGIVGTCGQRRKFPQV